MKDVALTSAVKEVVALKMSIVDEYIEDVVEVIENVGSPEKLIGKPYDMWTPQDIQMLTTIYGKGDFSPLQKVIFNREYKHLQELEQGV